MKQIISCIALMLVTTLSHAEGKLDKVLNIDKSTKKEWSNMIDNGGFFDTDKWQGIPVSNISAMHNRDTGKIMSFEISYAISKAASANSPKKLRGILEKYCKIAPDAWPGNDVTAQNAEGTRCNADYQMKGDVGHFIISKKE